MTGMGDPLMAGASLSNGPRGRLARNGGMMGKLHHSRPIEHG